MKATRLLVLCAVLAAAACGDEVETPTAPTAAEVIFTTEVFSGTLAVGGSRFYSYTTQTSGPVTAMLASLTRAGVVTPASNRLQLGIGVPAGTGCATRVTANTSPALVPQLMPVDLPGTYCVSVTDVDGLPSPMVFAVRIVHP